MGIERKRIKMAILCSGLGRIKRGFESFTEELFVLLKNSLDVDLFKGGGKISENERVLWCLKRDGLLRFLGVPNDKRLLFESFTFAFSFIPYLFRNKYNVLFVSAPGEAAVLMFLKRVFNLRYNVIISNGGPIRPSSIHYIDFIAQVTESEYRRSLEWGLSKNRVFLLPYGIFSNKFDIKVDKPALRTKYGIPESQYVLLCVGQINKFHKRIDFLIETVSRLDYKKFFLLIVGNSDLETEELRKMAGKLLKNNYRFLINIDYELMPEIYKVADCVIHCSLFEGFSRVLLESMSAKIPIIAHNMENNRWPINNEECLINMEDGDLLIDKIKAFSENNDLVREIVKSNYENVLMRFDWDVLKKQYLNILEHVAA
jgi:glycosyltransferase involved in cell wall biosynthesis